jgi:predicted nucleic acid-binding Zn ribbon protein
MRRLDRMLKDALGRDEVLRTARAQRILRDWEEVVGPVLGARSVPDRYDQGTVWVAVQGAAWAQELRMIKGEILSRLNERAHEVGMFRDMRFGVRPAREGLEPVEEEQRAPRPPRVEGLSIREIAEKRLKEWPDEAGD